MNSAFRFFVSVAIAALFAGCASSRIVAPHEVVAVTTPLDLRTPSESGLSVHVRHVIVPDGPGSWVKQAAWDEYRLVVTNASNEPLQIEAVQVASDRLLSAHQLDRAELEAISQQHFESLKTAGLVLVVGTVAVTTASTAALMAAGYTLVTPAAPIVLIAGGIGAYAAMSQRSKDRTAMDEEIARRGFRLPAALAPGAQVEASAFVPVTPAPLSLVVRYRIGSEARTAEVKLTPLFDLHLAKTPPPS